MRNLYNKLNMFTINMEFVDDIPVLSSNKRRAVINNYIK